MMKKAFVSCLAILFFSSKLAAQTFTNNTVAGIPDVNSVIAVPISVSGLAPVINAGFGLTGICINLTHPYIGELTIVLKSPSGIDSVRLLWHDGGNAAINSPICITEAGNDFIAAYPVAGVVNYYGEESNNIMNDGRDPNGIWSLRIIDVIPNNAGTINSVALTFGNNPPPAKSRVFECSTTTPWGCKCPDGTIDCDLLPDMTNAKLALEDNYVSGSELHFSVGTPNIGAGPLEMKASATECFCDETPVPCGTVCPAGQELKHNVYQTIYHRSGNTMTTSTTLAGQMEYHPTHNHIHLDHWTNNTLRIRSLDPNPTHWPIVGTSYKISFCLINLGNCDSYPGYCVDSSGNVLNNTNIANFGFGYFTGCSLEQGIYPGHVDQYSAGIDGQSISLDGICNGNYYLVSITDPDNNVSELNDKNNWSYTAVLVAQQPSSCCQAGFFADKVQGIDSLTVQFSDSTIAIPKEWHWDFGDGNTSLQQFPIHTYSEPGTYTVTLATQSETGCKDTLVKKDYITIRSSVPISNTTVTISPNPFTDQVVLRFRTIDKMNTSVYVYDAIGRRLHSEKINVPAGVSSLNLASPKIGSSAGLYFIKVSGGSYSKVFKVLRK